MSAATKESAPQPQSAAAPSPFTPIADYAFLSDCHTGALVAPDGSIDWLCLPAFDAPSVFGNLLDREAGSFRFGPYGINVPTQRHYVPGTHVLTTTWHTPGGWLLVHDALTMGPRQHRMAKLFDLTPAVSHRCSVPRSSRSSHNLAIFQSRFTVSRETSNASAVSSRLSPAK